MNTPPLSTIEKDFLAAYYKAANTSQPVDWMTSALLAKQMFNASRPNGNRDACQEESEISKDAQRHAATGTITNGMLSINTPPDTNRVVIVLLRTEDLKVIGATFRYKKGKWIGTSTGTPQDLEAGAVWIECPLQSV